MIVHAPLIVDETSQDIIIVVRSEPGDARTSVLSFTQPSRCYILLHGFVPPGMHVQIGGIESPPDAFRFLHLESKSHEAAPPSSCVMRLHVSRCVALFHKSDRTLGVELCVRGYYTRGLLADTACRTAFQAQTGT